MDANDIINRLIAEEMSANNAPDMKRVLRDERMALQARIQRGASAQDIKAKMDEAVGVAAMWGVHLIPQPVRYNVQMRDGRGGSAAAGYAETFGGTVVSTVTGFDGAGHDLAIIEIDATQAEALEAELEADDNVVKYL